MTTTAIQPTIEKTAASAVRPKSKPIATPGANAAGEQKIGWKISRRGLSCSACERPFLNGNLVFSCLVFAEAIDADQEIPIFSRVDRCGVCHQKREKKTHEIIWRSQYEESPKKAKLDLISLSEVFRQLVASNDERFRDLKFLVALLLLRHRRLRVARTYTENDRDFISVVFGRTKETAEVEASDLSKEQMEGLRSQLMAVFEGGELLPSAEHPVSEMVEQPVAEAV
ncbi:MAG: hypothetical protein ACKVS6_13100 [Planctomycetota bacterium]